MFCSTANNCDFCQSKPGVLQSLVAFLCYIMDMSFWKYIDLIRFLINTIYIFLKPLRSMVINLAVANQRDHEPFLQIPRADIFMYIAALNFLFSSFRWGSSGYSEFLWCRVGEPMYYHGPHKLCIIASGPHKNKFIL